MDPTTAHLLEQLSPFESCFSVEELARFRSALILAVERCPAVVPNLEAIFRQTALSVPLVAQAIERTPRTLASQRMGSRERGPETLIDQLCRSDQGCVEFSMPTRAILGRAFVFAKLNFLKAVLYALQDEGEGAGEAVGVVDELVGETVYSKLTEELLSAATANASNALDLRRVAARKLIAMWDEGLTLPVSRLPSILTSAWRARIKVRAGYGTLIGLSEVFSLMQKECEPRFVDFFVRDHVSDNEHQAFREFLFGLGYEDLQRVDRYMDEHQLGAVSAALIQEIVGSPGRPLPFGDPSPEHMYHSYWRRRIRAEYRVITDNPGPRKTAEGYIMEFLLREEAPG